MSVLPSLKPSTPADLQIKQKLALSFIAIGDNQKAIESLEAFVAEDPSQGRVYYYLGELYQQMGEPQKALMNFRFASKADPKDPAPLIKSALLQHEESPEESIETLLQGIEHLPENARLHELLAYTYFGLENHSDATTYFKRTLELKIKDGNAEKITPNFYFSQCVSLQHLERYDEAAESLVNAAQDNSSYLEAYLQYLFRSNDEDVRLHGISVFRKVSEKMSTDARPHLYLGMAYSYLKRYSEAVDAYEQTVMMIEKAPERYEDLNSAMIYFWYAAACERDTQTERAEELFHRCLEIDPEQAEAYNYLAYMWAEQGEQLERALEFVQKALDINPGSGAFIDTLGWVYFMQGQYDEALVEINRAADLIPDDPTIVEHLGDVLHKLGKTEEALPHWKQSFILEPENEKLAEKLSGHGIDLAPLREKAASQAEDGADEAKSTEIDNHTHDTELESHPAELPAESEEELSPLPES